MRTKAYSARFKYEDELDEEIILKLDEIDDQELDPGEWIREAARMRLLAEQKEMEQLEKLDELVELDEVLIEKDPNDGIPGAFRYQMTDAESPIERLANGILIQLTEEEQMKYIRDAIEMRVAIESHAPAYFIDRFQSMASDSPGWLETAIDRSDDGNHHIDTESASEVKIEAYDDGFSLYRDSLPALLRLEMMDRD